jgi:hypothetical protein
MVAVACSSGSGPTRPPGEVSAAETVAPTTTEAPAQVDAATTVVATAQPDDGTRCARLRELVEAAADLGALQRSLTEAVPSLGFARGESLMAARELVSFCVAAEPGLSPSACLSTLGFERPIAIRMSPKEKANWQIHESRPQPGKPFATRAPRYGPATIIPMIAAPPRGKPEPGAPEGLPIFSVDHARDVVVELCFTQRSIGEE